MSKAPLKQLSVNTFERTRAFSPKLEGKKSKSNNIEIRSSKRKHPVCRQLVPVEESSVETQTDKSAHYWETMAEQYRKKLEELMRENQQLHEIVDELTKDNEQLRSVVDNCEYLANVLEKLASDE